MTGFGVGDPVVAIGTSSVVLGETVVLDASVFPQGQPAVVRPFGMKNAAVGGASQWPPMCIRDCFRHKVFEDHVWTWHYDWLPTSGANNTGLLVNWGTVQVALPIAGNGASWLYVDDGSRVVSDLGDVGVLVYSDADVSRGDFVSIQGIEQRAIAGRSRQTDPCHQDPRCGGCRRAEGTGPPCTRIRFRTSSTKQASTPAGSCDRAAAPYLHARSRLAGDHRTAIHRVHRGLQPAGDPARLRRLGPGDKTREPLGQGLPASFIVCGWCSKLTPLVLHRSVRAWLPGGYPPRNRRLPGPSWQPGEPRIYFI